ncbi:MAG: hypothetical protein K2N04_00330 [Alistipes sp.]|nr:hypothetical protein [Alistipes sp.]
MGTLITIWLAVMGIYYLCAATLRLAIKLPAAVVFVIALPAMPFIVAYRNKAEHPIQAKAIYWLGGIFYALIALIVIADGHL